MTSWVSVVSNGIERVSLGCDHGRVAWAWMLLPSATSLHLASARVWRARVARPSDPRRSQHQGAPRPPKALIRAVARRIEGHDDEEDG
eukprot:5965831-Pyramimonas_sp.AAC.1